MVEPRTKQLAADAEWWKEGRIQRRRNGEELQQGRRCSAEARKMLRRPGDDRGRRGVVEPDFCARRKSQWKKQKCRSTAGSLIPTVLASDVQRFPLRWRKGLRDSDTRTFANGSLHRDDASTGLYNPLQSRPKSSKCSIPVPALLPRFTAPKPRQWKHGPWLVHPAASPRVCLTRIGLAICNWLVPRNRGCWTLVFSFLRRAPRDAGVRRGGGSAGFLFFFGSRQLWAFCCADGGLPV